MFIYVRLLNGFRKPLWYQAPPTDISFLVGSVVHVPLKKRVIPALVIAQNKNKPADVTFAIKQAESVEAFPADTLYWQFITQLADYHRIEPLHFVTRIKQFLTKEKVKTRTQKNDASAAQEHASQTITLNEQQERAYTSIAPSIHTPRYCATVLHGVTGSGKTEVYKKLIHDTLAQNKTVLLLLPEVTLAVAFEHRIKKELGPDVLLYSFHSATSAAEKRTVWEHLLAKKPIVILGVHLPVLLPIANLGLIIVDEEHESGYQEKKHPKINSKDAAVWRAHTYNIPIVLGSATPSLQTLHNVKTKGWQFAQLTHRFAGAFPKITTAYLSDKKRRKNFWLSQQLYDAIKDRLARGEQTILFLNRRGHSFFVQCAQCSFIFACNSCSVSLTLHTDETLRCHYCSYKRTLPNECTSCEADASTFIKKGIGTQRVVSIVESLFPHAQVARADLDSTTKRTTWQQTMDKFEKGDIDILVGTQTITKGYDFPNVTLVGIIWADLNLNFPQYNAGETTLQQLIQVAGRAGRKHAHSDVIVQAMGHHSIFGFLNETDYLQYYAQEMATRKELGYPPHKRLAMIELKHTSEATVEKDAYAVAQHLQTTRQRKNLDVQILGPTQPPVHKIQRTCTQQIYLKVLHVKDVHTLVDALNTSKYKSTILFNPSVT